MNRRLRLSLASLPLLLLCLACGLGGEPDPSELRGYSAESVRWGTRCDPFAPVQDATFAGTDEPCVELELGGYYTAGTLTAVWMFGEREIGRAQIEFNTAQALARRMSTGEAAARVTFQLHHPASEPLPASDQYAVQILRGPDPVARYAFVVR